MAYFVATRNELQEKGDVEVGKGKFSPLVGPEKNKTIFHMAHHLGKVQKSQKQIITETPTPN